MNEEVILWYVVAGLAVIPWVTYAVMIMLFIASIGYGRLRLYKTSNPLDTLDDLPGVSVIKPLMGIDPFLEKNIESHFVLSYPKYELLFCVQDPNDAAVQLVHTVQQRHPDVPCRLFVGGKNGILNPMVCNMAPAYDNSQYDVVWVSTSRIFVTTEILLDMVAKLQNPNVALVHQLPFTTDQPGFSAAVEKIYFGASAARFILAAHTLGISCFTGMSYLIKKPKLDTLNGLSWFGRFLAEDFFIAKLLHEMGFYHQVAAIPAQQNVANSSIVAYKDRMVRWARLRLNMMPITSGFLEPLCESVPLGIYASWSAYFLFDLNPYLWFAGHWIVWCCLDYIQLTGVQHGALPFSRLTFVVAWVVRELMFVLIYFEAILNPRTISWGKNTYRLSDFGRSLKLVSDRSVLPL